MVPEVRDGAAPPPALLAELLQAPAPEPPRRAALLALAGVVVTAGLAGGGWAGTQWLRDGDLRGALTSSRTAVAAVVAQVERAEGARELMAVADGAELAALQVARAGRRAQRQTGPRADVVQAEIAAQAAVVAALAPLEGMGTGPLQAFGRARAPLAQALAAERRTRDRLRDDRGEEADRLAVVDRLLPGLDRAGRPLLERAASAELRRVAGVLAGARTTADVRAAGEVAAGQVQAVRRSAQGAPAGSALARCAAVVGAVAGLTDLSGQVPDGWGPARARLVPVLADPDALRRVDAVVAAAVAGTAAWQASLSDADAARAADAQALAAHGQGVRGLLAPYGRLDASLTARLDTLAARRADPYDLAVLADDVHQRRRLADALAGVVAPGLVQAEHAVLVQAVAADAAAVQALVDGLAAQAGAPLLPPAAPVSGVVLGGPLAELVAQREALAQARRAAARGWDAATARAVVLVAKRPLPEPPDL